MWLRRRGASGGARPQRDGAVAQDGSTVRTAHLIFFFHFSHQRPRASASGSRAGVLGSARRTPSPAAPQGGEPRGAGAADSAESSRQGSPASGCSGRELSWARGRGTSGPGSRSELLQSFPPEAASALEESRRRTEEGGEDVRSAPLPPAAELGRARALPLAAEEGTVVRVRAAELRRRLAACGVRADPRRRESRCRRGARPRRRTLSE